MKTTAKPATPPTTLPTTTGVGGGEELCGRPSPSPEPALGPEPAPDVGLCPKPSVGEPGTDEPVDEAEGKREFVGELAADPVPVGCERADVELAKALADVVEVAPVERPNGNNRPALESDAAVIDKLVAFRPREGKRTPLVPALSGSMLVEFGSEPADAEGVGSGAEPDVAKGEFVEAVRLGRRDDGGD